MIGKNQMKMMMMRRVICSDFEFTWSFARSTGPTGVCADAWPTGERGDSAGAFDTSVGTADGDAGPCYPPTVAEPREALSGT